MFGLSVHWKLDVELPVHNMISMVPYDIISWIFVGIQTITSNYPWIGNLTIVEPFRNNWFIYIYWMIMKIIHMAANERLLT